MKTSANVSFQIILFALVAALTATDAGRTGRLPHRQKSSGALEALRFFSESRAYPGIGLANDKYLASHEKSFLKKKAATRSAGGSGWRSLGPLNVSGRTISVAINPRNSNTVYVGSASGGLWRSYSGESTPNWERLETGYPVLGVKAIAVDSVDTNNVYIGTGEVYRYKGTNGGVAVRTTRGSYGLGILKSTDAGSTWKKSLDWENNVEGGVQCIRINPRNHNTIFAATTEGIYKSFDKGETWRNVLPVLMAQDLVIQRSDSGIMMASCGNFSTPGAGIYVSVESGEPGSWFKLDAIPPFSGKAVLEPSPRDDNTVFLSVADSTTGVGALYRTQSFGTGWTLVANAHNNVFGVQGWYSHIVALHPWEENTFFHGGVPLTRTTDGGNFFMTDQSVHSDIHSHAHSYSDPRTIYITNDAGIVRSTDFGLLFDDISYGMQTTQFYNGFANAPYDSNFAFGQMQDHIPGYYYSGSGDWTEMNIDEVGWSAIDPSDQNNLYAMSRQGGSVYKSTNRGSSFYIIPIPGTGAWNSPIVISPSDPAILFAGKVKIYKSTDAGFSWAATNQNNNLDGNPVLSMAISPLGPDTLYAGTVPGAVRSHLYRTVDGGANWTDVTGTLPDRYPMDIAVDPRSSSLVYAVFGGYGSGHVFRSSDAGDTWIDISGNLPDVHATAVIVDPFNPEHIYLGNDIGVYLSTDRGSSWTGFADGLPEAILVADLGICYANQSLRAATHGNGLFERRLHSAVTSATGEGSLIPNEVALFQNYPNPFNPTTKISYKLSMRRHLRLRIYDNAGREVAELPDLSEEPGEHEALFNGDGLPTGIYYYSLEIGRSRMTKKMILLR